MSELSECTEGVWWFDAYSTRRRRARLRVADGVLFVVSEDGERRDAALDALRISPRLGNTPRRVEFADGAALSVTDNEWVDAALRGSYRSRGAALLHVLESRWRWLVLLTVLASVTVYAVVVYALPVAGRVAAELVPQAYLKTISDTVYTQLVQEEILTPSALRSKRRENADLILARVAAAYAADGYDYRLKLHRLGDSDIANAFAFPDGLIVATDKLVLLLNEEELTAVLAHEIGHVQKRHGMSLLLQSSALAGFVALVSGDVSLLFSAGAGLLNFKYSRDYEREADCFAFDYLRQNDLPESLIGTALQKIEQTIPFSKYEPDEAAEKADNETGESQGEDEGEGDDKHSYAIAFLELISTHPATDARTDLAAVCGGSGKG